MKNVRLSLPKEIFFFRISLIYHTTGFPYLLTTFRRMSGWVDLIKCFVRISLIYYFTGFPYLLTTFSKDVWLCWPQIFFFCIVLIYHFTRFPYLLTTFSKDVWLSWPQTLFLVSCLADFRSGFWHWKWLPEGVTHSSTSQTTFFSYLA